jgi:hypothetical protein
MDRVQTVITNPEELKEYLDFLYSCGKITSHEPSSVNIDGENTNCEHIYTTTNVEIYFSDEEQTKTKINGIYLCGNDAYWYRKSQTPNFKKLFENSKVYLENFGRICPQKKIDITIKNLLNPKEKQVIVKIFYELEYPSKIKNLMLITSENVTYFITFNQKSAPTIVVFPGINYLSGYLNVELAKLFEYMGNQNIFSILRQDFKGTEYTFINRRISTKNYRYNFIYRKTQNKNLVEKEYQIKFANINFIFNLGLF